jgi:hypothetical protein
MTMLFGRVLRTGLSSLRDRAAARLAASRFNPSRTVEPDFMRDARCNPQNYFRCSNCGSGPWHNSWAAIHTTSFLGKPDFYMPKKPLGGCCSGAD